MLKHQQLKHFFLDLLELCTIWNINHTFMIWNFSIKHFESEFKVILKTWSFQCQLNTAPHFVVLRVRKSRVTRVWYQLNQIIHVHMNYSLYVEINIKLNIVVYFLQICLYVFKRQITLNFFNIFILECLQKFSCHTKTCAESIVTSLKF